MKDMVPKGTGNSRYLKSVSNFMTLYPTYADFAAALVAGTLPVDFNGINSAGCDEVGTALNKANLLTDATVAALGTEIVGAEPTVDIALRILADKANEPNISPITVFRSTDYTAGETIYLAPGVVGKTVLVLFDGKGDGSVGNFGNLYLQLPSAGSVDAGAEFDVICMYENDCSGTLGISTPSNVLMHAPGNVLVGSSASRSMKTENGAACVFKLMIDAANSENSKDEWVVRGDI